MIDLGIDVSKEKLLNAVEDKRFNRLGRLPVDDDDVEMGVVIDCRGERVARAESRSWWGVRSDRQFAERSEQTDGDRCCRGGHQGQRVAGAEKRRTHRNVPRQAPP